MTSRTTRNVWAYARSQSHFGAERPGAPAGRKDLAAGGVSYTQGVTAKQLLHEFIDSLSEDEAAVTASMLIPTVHRRLSDEERRAIEQGLAELDAGNRIPLEEIEREFGLT